MLIATQAELADWLHRTHRQLAQAFGTAWDVLRVDSVPVVVELDDRGEPVRWWPDE